MPGTAKLGQYTREGRNQPVLYNCGGPSLLMQFRVYSAEWDWSNQCHKALASKLIQLEFNGQDKQSVDGVAVHLAGLESCGLDGGDRRFIQTPGTGLN